MRACRKKSSYLKLCVGGAEQHDRSSQTDSQQLLPSWLVRYENNFLLLRGGGRSKILIGSIQQEVLKAAGEADTSRKENTTDKHQTAAQVPRVPSSLQHKLL